MTLVKISGANREDAGFISCWTAMKAGVLFINDGCIQEFIEIPAPDALARTAAAFATLRAGPLQVGAGGEQPCTLRDPADILQRGSRDPIEITLVILDPFCQGCRRHGSDRHALPINRVEAAERIAQNDQAFGPAIQFFVVMSAAGCAAITYAF